MNEYRRKRRRNPDGMIEVHDVMTEALIGRIGNLSETGMLIHADIALVDDALYQFRFALHDEAGSKHTYEIGAHHLWSDAAGTPGQFWTGVRFIDVSPGDMQHLRQWVQQPGGEVEWR
jgi:hypothetical protein